MQLHGDLSLPHTIMLTSLGFALCRCHVARTSPAGVLKHSHVQALSVITQVRSKPSEGASLHS
jgi:hypothetical protein